MMKVSVRQTGIAVRKWIDSAVKKQILALAPLRQIDEAQVQIARDREVSPPYRVNVYLVTPGPDIAAEARDHTFAAALKKVLRIVTDEIQKRAAKQISRRRTDTQRLLPQHMVARGA